MDILDTKHETLRILVAAVLRRVPPSELVVFDWRNGDPFALALGLRSGPARRVYVSYHPAFSSYMLSFEPAPNLDSSMVHNIESDPFTDVDSLSMAIAQDLGAA